MRDSIVIHLYTIMSAKCGNSVIHFHEMKIIIINNKNIIFHSSWLFGLEAFSVSLQSSHEAMVVFLGMEQQLFVFARTIKL